METNTFTRWDGSGETTEYKDNAGYTLAYIDYNADKTEASVTVFYPYKETAKHYSSRPVVKALAIVTRHLERN